MYSFVRMTKLSNIGGRADYISNPDRQENLLFSSTPVDWQPYADFEKNNKKSTEPNNEGRELIISIPNSWDKLSKKKLEARCTTLIERALGKNTDYQFAVHYNKIKSNLHLHVIFSERQRTEPTGEVWDRNIYLTDDGRIARKKTERAKDDNGRVLAPVHRKGEPKSNGFTNKDKKYKSSAWLENVKAEVLVSINEIDKKADVKAPTGYFHEFHEGKGNRSNEIFYVNEVIRATNKEIERLIEEGKTETRYGTYFQNTFPAKGTPEFKEFCRAVINHALNAESPLNVPYFSNEGYSEREREKQRTMLQREATEKAKERDELVKNASWYLDCLEQHAEHGENVAFMYTIREYQKQAFEKLLETEPKSYVISNFYHNQSNMFPAISKTEKYKAEQLEYAKKYDPAYYQQLTAPKEHSLSSAPSSVIRQPEQKNKQRKSTGIEH